MNESDSFGKLQDSRIILSKLKYDSANIPFEGGCYGDQIRNIY